MSVVVTQTAPSHVAAFSSSGYKRSFSSVNSAAIDEPTVPPALRVPDVPAPNVPFQTQPFCQTNARVPMARACLPQLRAGSVAFVSRGVGPKSGKDGKGPEVCSTAPGIHAIGMEELNELLAQPHNFVYDDGDPGNKFYERSAAVGLFKPKVKDGKVSYTGIVGAKVMRAAYDVVKGKFTHPLVQYALDGVVATRPEVDSIISISESAGNYPGAVCNVAVHGPAALKVKLAVQDPLKSVRAATSSVAPDVEVTPENYYVRPLGIAAVLYVVLVAKRVEGQPGKWMFQYDLASSTHLSDVNRLARTRFLDDVAADPADTSKKKLILRVEKLGVVTDSNFVSDQKEAIVSIGIRRVEATRRAKEPINIAGNTTDVPYTEPLDVFKTFQQYEEPLRIQERVLMRGAQVHRTTNNKTYRFSRFKAQYPSNIGEGAATFTLEEVQRLMAQNFKSFREQITGDIDGVKNHVDGALKKVNEKIDKIEQIVADEFYDQSVFLEEQFEGSLEVTKTTGAEIEEMIDETNEDIQKKIDEQASSIIGYVSETQEVAEAERNDQYTNNVAEKVAQSISTFNRIMARAASKVREISNNIENKTAISNLVLMKDAVKKKGVDTTIDLNDLQPDTDSQLDFMKIAVTEFAETFLGEGIDKSFAIAAMLITFSNGDPVLNSKITDEIRKKGRAQLFKVLFDVNPPPPQGLKSTKV